MADMTLKMLLLGQDVSASRAMKGVGRTTDETAGKFGKWHAAAAIAGAVAGAAVFKFGKDSVSAYEEAQSQQAQLEAAYKKFPALADTNIGALRKLNTELERKTGFDDDATASGQAVLAQFGLTGKQITSLTPLLQDYAKRTGKDLPTAAKDLGKAVEGQGRALKNVGVNFKDTHSAAGNFDEIMKGLSGTVGGFAEDQGKTAAGQTQILKAEFGELEETVGSKLVPALTGLVGVGLKVIDFISRNAKVIGPAVLVVGGLALAVWAVNAASKAYAATQAALNIVLSANPIGLIIIAIAALVIGLVVAYKKSETFRNIVNGAFHAVAAVVGAVVGFIRNHWQLLFAILTGPVGLAVLWITRHWDGVVTFFKKIPGRIGSVIGGVIGVLTSPFRTAFNAIADLWNGTVGQLSFHVPDWVPGLGGKGFSMPTLPHLAAGGIVTRPTIALLGEAGPERITPLSAGRAGQSGGDTYHFTVQAGVGDPVAIGKQIESIMQKLNQRTGRPAQFKTA